MAAAEERKKETEGEEMETVYKMKAVQFLGRSTAIVLQNDNGPCPLLAICNVLLLKNILNLSLDASEVSLQKLLSLVAERLIDSNSNIQDKDDGYVNNQQQNIADAIDLLPRLATGIDVNVHFRKINDFEFTRECAIFDLLDIPIYHGWIVDPQDSDTAAVIGSKSYNTLVAELVDFETRKLDVENNQTEEEDCVDFVAATTAALGVPSPCLSRGRSFDDCPVPDQKGRGDMEEEEELLRVLDITKDESPKAVNISETPAAAPSPGTQIFRVLAARRPSSFRVKDQIFIVNMSDKEGNRIFVGGLSWDTTERHLERAFDPFGKVIEAQVVFTESCLIGYTEIKLPQDIHNGTVTLFRNRSYQTGKHKIGLMFVDLLNRCRSVAVKPLKLIACLPSSDIIAAMHLQGSAVLGGLCSSRKQHGSMVMLDSCYFGYD